MTRLKIFALIICAVVLLMTGCIKENHGTQELLNASCEPTRDFYSAYNEIFKRHWEKELDNGEVIITQSHGASRKQALAVIDGAINADVVTLSISYDVTIIRNAGLIRGGWRREFPGNSSPYTSTIVFLVRKGNPKNIHDWDDLVREDIKVVTANPKTSGGGRWNYLSAWEFARRKFGENEERIKDFMRKIFVNVVSLDEEVRSAKESFISGKGDVLIAWENEALHLKDESPEFYDIVTPSLSILAEMSVAVVDKNVEEKGNRELAEEYLRYLYSPEAQELAAQNFYRPRDRAILKKYSAVFKPLQLFTIDEVFGGWVKATNEHFADGAIFDQISKKVD
ncbi:MAG: sulfate ABC transporter substrate-binding protein [Selenomonadaceae bacterium]|nr:sulfate ABC transporter substrate-binding protein [Selenomonadaceae bacterium]